MLISIFGASKKTCGALCSKAPLLLMKSGKSRKMKNKKTLQKKMQAKADKTRKAQLSSNYYEMCRNSKKDECNTEIQKQENTK